jgi:DNA-binding NarL/FixJ family response regulator
MQAKRVVIAEDYRILREGLRSLLAEDQSLEIVAEAEDGIEAIRCVETHKPELLLLDLSMPRMGGIDVIKEVKSRFPETKILVLTMHDSDEYILEAIRCGANGYCLKEASRQELFDAIKCVLAGKAYLSPAISEKVTDDYLEDRPTLKMQTTWETVTRREKEVLKLVGEGCKNKGDCRTPRNQHKDRRETSRQYHVETGSPHHLCRGGLCHQKRAGTQT